MKCEFENCKKPTLLTVGYCKYCKGNFCNIHRIVEQHLCKNISTCRFETMEKYRKKILDGKCIGAKVQKI